MPLDEVTKNPPEEDEHVFDPERLINDEKEQQPREKPESKAEIEPKSKSLFDVPTLLGDFKSTLNGIGEKASSFLPSAEMLLGGQKKEAKEQSSTTEAPNQKSEQEKKTEETLRKANLAIDHADSHNAAYLSMQHRRVAQKLEPGEHSLPDGSSHKVDSSGRISELSLKSATDATKVLSYKNITYDANGEILSYMAPSGHQFRRFTDTDKAGFGTWMVHDSNGQRVPFAGSNSWEWRGKVSADVSGFHQMVDSGPNLGKTLFSSASDGTFIQSRDYQHPQTGRFIQTTVNLPDGTELVRNSVIAKDSFASNPLVRLTELSDGSKRQVIIDTAKSGGKIVEPQSPKAETPEVLRDSNKIADKVLDRLEGSKNPVGDLSSALTNMERLQSAKLTRLADGRHKVELSFDQSSVAPAIRATIRGFTPGPTTVAQNIDFILSHSQSGGVKLDNMNGFTGTVTGPLGRTRFSGTDAMHIGKDARGVPYVDIDSHVQFRRRSRASQNRFYEHNFDESSPIRQLMKNPNSLQEVGSALRMFQRSDDLSHVNLRQSSKGKFEVSTTSTEAKTIPVNQKLENMGVLVESIHIGQSLSATLCNDSKGVSLTGITGMKIKVDTGTFGKQDITPKHVGLTNDSKGVPIVHVEIEINNQPVKFDVPVSKLQEMRKQKTQSR